MSRRLRYSVATSLDGFIAGPNGEYDWIVADPSIDFAALFREFDTLVMGRKTYEVVKAQGGDGATPGVTSVVFSRTLPPEERPGVRIVDEDPAAVVAELKSRPGKDIWLFGGSSLFLTLLKAGLVDTVEVAVIPVLLGDGVPLLPPGATTKLTLADHKVLPTSGIVSLSYVVEGSTAAAAPIQYTRPAKVARKRVAKRTKANGAATAKVAKKRVAKQTKSTRATPAKKRRSARAAPTRAKAAKKSARPKRKR